MIKCHIPFDFLPDNILERCKVIYMARNPKDTAVSFYHHLKRKGHFKGEFCNFAKILHKCAFLHTFMNHYPFSNQNLQLPTTTIYVDSWDAFAAGSIFWQNEDCPTQQFFIKGSEIIQPLPYYDYCGNFTITAQSLSPLPQADCAVESNEYPTPYYNTRIPNWKISKTRYGCTIGNVDFLEFYVFVEGWKKSASVFVDWKNCPSQTVRVWGNSPFPPSFQYGPYCDDYIVIATIDGITCSWGSSRYPIPNLKANSYNGTCTIEKVVSV